MDDKEKRLLEIEKRIEDLTEHSKMWFKAGGIGGNMGMRAMGEVADLKREYNDLKYGTKERELKEVKRLQDLAKFKLMDEKDLLNEANFINRKFRQRNVEKQKAILDNYTKQVEELEEYNKQMLKGKEKELKM